MRHYPISLSLAGRRCLVVGGGGVGCRKLATMLSCSPDEVLVLETAEPCARLCGLLEHPAVRLARRSFEESDLEGRFLAVIATGDRECNARIARSCRERGVLCNVVDAPEEGDFIVPAHICQGDLVVTVSTSGQSPALARAIRQDLQEYLALRYEDFLTVMGRLRPLVLGLGASTGDNTELFRSLVASDLALVLQERDLVRARAVLVQLLPPSLHPMIDEVLHGLD